MSTCISWDESVISYNAVVDQDGDLVHVGDFLAYRSDGSNEVKQIFNLQFLDSTCRQNYTAYTCVHK